MEQGARTGFVMGYGSYCRLTMRYGKDAGSLKDGTGWKKGVQTIPLVSASYYKGASVPTQRTFAVAFDDQTRSPIRTGYGVWTYSGNLSFDLSSDLRDLIFDKDQQFFKRNSFLDIDLCDGEKYIKIPGAVWSSLSITANENSLVNGSIGFSSCNGYDNDIILRTIPGKANYPSIPELQPYWQYGNNGVTALTLNISRQVSPVYLNEKDWPGPAYLRVGMMDVSVDVTCWETWREYYKFALGSKNIEFKGTYATSKAWNFSGLGGNGTKTYNMSIYGLESTEPLFTIS